jgi:hypothetical protein
VLCWCTTHEPQDAEHSVVDADLWLREAAGVLTDRYGCKFFYWNA